MHIIHACIRTCRIWDRRTLVMWPVKYVVWSTPSVSLQTRRSTCSSTRAFSVESLFLWVPMPTSHTHAVVSYCCACNILVLNCRSVIFDTRMYWILLLKSKQFMFWRSLPVRVHGGVVDKRKAWPKSHDLWYSWPVSSTKKQWKVFLPSPAVQCHLRYQLTLPDDLAIFLCRQIIQGQRKHFSIGQARVMPRNFIRF
jgi:hypothetical protein